MQSQDESNKRRKHSIESPTGSSDENDSSQKPTSQTTTAELETPAATTTKPTRRNKPWKKSDIEALDKAFHQFCKDNSLKKEEMIDYVIKFRYKGDKKAQKYRSELYKELNAVLPERSLKSIMGRAL